MSDTSLVFDLLGRDRVSKVLGVIRSSFQSAGRTAEDSMRKANTSTEKLDRQIQETERHLEELNREFAATGDKTLFGKMARDRTLLTQLRRVRDEVGRVNSEADRSSLSRWMDQFRDGSSTIGRVVSQLGAFGSAAASAGGPLFMLAAAVLAAAAALTSLGPALALAGGALGSLPGIIGGAAAAFGTLKLGLFGLTSEYQRLTKATGGGGGGAAGAQKDFTAQTRAVEQAVKAVTRAERDLKDAQKDALRAQREINDARKEASDRMRDQAMDLDDARISEAEAVDDLETAERELAEARASGDLEAIDDAQRAYDRAALSVERAKIRTQELEEATAKNAKTGVEGSEEVTEAKEREAQATRRVKDAEEARADAIQRVADARKALADAQSAGGGGGGGGGGAEITKLAPSARAFLNTIIGLRPAFERLRLGVQERLFSGLAGKMQHLADVWKGPLTRTLNNYATTFNGIAKTFFDSASKKTFIDGVTAGAESARKALGEIGQAVAGPLMEAFGRLSRAAGPFIEKIGTLIAGAAEKFSDWIASADRSGKLTSFFQGAATTLQKVATLGGKVGTVIGKIIGIIYGDSKAAGDSALDSMSAGLEKVSVWLDKPENQKAIRDLVDGFFEFGRQVKGAGELISGFGAVAGPVLSTVATVVKFLTRQQFMLVEAFGALRPIWRWIEKNGPRAWNGIRTGITSAYNWVVSTGGRLVGWVRALPGRISRAAGGMWNGIRDSFRAALNWVIGRWNNLRLSLPEVNFLGQQIGGGSIGMPHVDYLAKGGIVPATPGGRLAVIGEGGEDEAVIPLSKLSQMAPSAPMRGEITLKLDFGDSVLGQAMAKTVRTQPAVAAEMGKYIKVRVVA